MLRDPARIAEARAKYEELTRKTPVLGMSNEELANLVSDEKIEEAKQLLVASIKQRQGRP